MKKILSLALLGICTTAMADVTVNVNPATGMTDYAAEYAYISDLVKPRRERPQANRVSGTLTDGTFTIPGLDAGASRYIIPAGENEYVMLFVEPGENLVVDINSINPLDYDVKGSALMSDIVKIDKAASDVTRKFHEMQATGTLDGETLSALQNQYYKVYTDFIAKNPTNPAVGYALLNLEGEAFINGYNSVEPTIEASLFYPILSQQKTYEERAVETEKKRAAMANGTVDAPNFTLANPEGKMISLSDFKGKWVILDFWGSWCRWCIKGFPHLKETYAQYAPGLEVIGIDCNETQEAWKAAIVKYELPWVNVYNPEGNEQLLKDYTVEGFPTKIIVNPEGKIANITVGDDPNFYEILANLMKK